MTTEPPALGESPATTRPIRVLTWNMDHWKRSAEDRAKAWTWLRGGIADVALLQECVPPADLPRERCAYREIGGTRPWGTAVVALHEDFRVEEIGAVQTRYGQHRFSMLGSRPGAVMVARVSVPDVGEISGVSVYGLMDPIYAQTTMFRVVADLVPLFDSQDGARVLFGGDFNVSTACPRSTPELPRYKAILQAVRSLGLDDLVERAAGRPKEMPGCRCGESHCTHLPTYRRQAEDGSAVDQLDYLYATPGLAGRCRSLLLADAESVGLSDHVPIIAELDVPRSQPGRVWTVENFVAEIAARHREAAGAVVGAVVAWVHRRQKEWDARSGCGCRLDRLPISIGDTPEMWVQIDLPEHGEVQYTVSFHANGNVVVQFQHMRCDLQSEAERAIIWEKLRAIPGVEIERRLTGRPTFPITALSNDDARRRFLEVLDFIVDRTVR